jgi:hypothetical protein
MTCNYALQITDTWTSVLSLLQSPLAVSWQRILTQELYSLTKLLLFTAALLQLTLFFTAFHTGLSTELVAHNILALIT